MDTARITAALLAGAGLTAVTYIDTYDPLPLIHVTQTRIERNDLFGLDTLTLTTYAPGRTAALDTLEEALALADGRPVFDAEHGLVDRLSRFSGPVPATFTDQLMTASAEVTAEYRL